MLRTTFWKLSSFFLLLHRRFKKLAERKVGFKPYRLKNKPSDSDKKIIHFIANFIVGGSSQLIVDIIERSSDAYSHKIVVPDYDEPLPYQPVDIHKFSIDDMAALHAFLRAEKPALVHIHYYVREVTRYEGKAFWYYAVFRVCEDLGIRVIQNVNVPTSPYPSRSVVHNVFVSRFVRDNFNTSPEVASSVIYPGSDFSHFVNADTDVASLSSIGMVYRLDQDKLNEAAIEIFIGCAKAVPGLQCYIVGGGYFLDYYKNRVKEEGLAKQFTFSGFVSYEELPSWYKKIGIFIAPVHDESFGQVTPFAMNMGCAVAGYNTGALAEILGSADTLVEYGKAEELISLVVDLLNKKEERKRISEQNRARAMNFSVESMIRDYRELYPRFL